MLHENLIESELFGYEKGAFTGAASAGKIGKIELANHGTLFLDEIGELPPHIQSKLLQLIQEKTIERVSGTKRIELDFRLLVATNRNLEEEVQRGLFRSDLFYRLNVIRVHIPPLRQRPEDILPMAHQFLERFCKEYGKQLALSPRFVAFLEQYPWPGNVRQLENLMERLVITAQNPILDITAPAAGIQQRRQRAGPPLSGGDSGGADGCLRGTDHPGFLPPLRHHGGRGEGTGHFSGHRCPENRQICEGPEGMKLL